MAAVLLLFLALLFMGLRYVNRVIVVHIRLRGLFGFIVTLVVALIANYVVLGVALYFASSGGTDSGPIITAFGTIAIATPVAFLTAVTTRHYMKFGPKVLRNPDILKEEPLQ